MKLILELLKVLINSWQKHRKLTNQKSSLDTSFFTEVYEDFPFSLSIRRILPLPWILQIIIAPDLSPIICSMQLQKCNNIQKVCFLSNPEYSPGEIKHKKLFSQTVSWAQTHRLPSIKTYRIKTPSNFSNKSHVQVITVHKSWVLCVG